MELMQCFEQGCKNEVEYSCPCTFPETLFCELHFGKHLKPSSRNHPYNSIFIEPCQGTKDEILKLLKRENLKNSKLKQKILASFSQRLLESENDIEELLKNLDSGSTEISNYFTKVSQTQKILISEQGPFLKLKNLQPDEAIEQLKKIIPANQESSKSAELFCSLSEKIEKMIECFIEDKFEAYLDKRLSNIENTLQEHNKVIKSVNEEHKNSIDSTNDQIANIKGSISKLINENKKSKRKIDELNSQIIKINEGLCKINEFLKSQKILQELREKKSKILNSPNDPELEQDFRRTSSKYSSDFYAEDLTLQQAFQDYANTCYRETSLYSIIDDNDRISLTIYDTENDGKEARIEETPELLDCGTCISLTPNGLFCFGCYSPTYGISLIIDENYRVRQLPFGNLCFRSSAIYFNNSVCCFGGRNNNGLLTLSERFDLNESRWIELESLPKADSSCNSVIFEGNIVISGWNNKNLLRYSINSNTFATISYDFKGSECKILISAERLYLIECKNGSIYESEISNGTAWRWIADSIINADFNQVYLPYNKGGINTETFLAEVKNSVDLVFSKIRSFLDFDFHTSSLLQLWKKKLPALQINKYISPADHIKSINSFDEKREIIIKNSSELSYWLCPPLLKNFLEWLKFTRINFNLQVSSFFELLKKMWVTFKFIYKVSLIKDDDEMNNFTGYTDLIYLIKKVNNNVSNIAILSKWFDDLGNSINKIIPNKLWFLENKLDDKIIFSIWIYESAKEFVNVIPNIYNDNIITTFWKNFADYIEKLEEISNKAKRNELNDADSQEGLLNNYETMVYNFWKVSKLNSIIGYVDKYQKIRDELNNIIEKEIELKLHFLLGHIKDNQYKATQLSLNFKEEDKKCFKYIHQCRNISEFEEIFLRVKSNLEKKIKKEYINNFLDHLKEHENLLANQDELINAAKYLLKANKILGAFGKSGPKDYITRKFWKVRKNLSDAMDEFYYTKLTRNLCVCIRISDELKALDEEKNLPCEFANLYDMHNKRYLKLLNSIYEGLKVNLKNEDIVSFCFNIKNLPDNKKALFIKENEDQIKDLLEDYMEKVWERLKEKKEIMIANNIDKFFLEMKKVAVAVEYMDYDLNIDIRKISISKEMEGKVLITENDIKRWDKRISGLPEIFKKWEEIFKTLAIPPIDEVDNTSQSLVYSDELKKSNIHNFSCKLFLIFLSCKETKQWIEKAIEKIPDINLGKDWIIEIINKAIIELIDYLDNVSEDTTKFGSYKKIKSEILLKIHNLVSSIMSQDYPDSLLYNQDLLKNLYNSIAIYIFSLNLYPKMQPEIEANMPLALNSINHSTLKSEEKKHISFDEQKAENPEEIESECEILNELLAKMENLPKVTSEALSPIIVSKKRNKLKNWKFDRKVMWRKKKNNCELNLNLSSRKKLKEICKAKEYKPCSCLKTQNCNSIVEFSDKDILWRENNLYWNMISILNPLSLNLKIADLMSFNLFPKKYEVGLIAVSSEILQNFILNLSENNVFGLKSAMKVKPPEIKFAKNAELDDCKYSTFPKFALWLDRLEVPMLEICNLLISNFIYDIKLKFDASSLCLPKTQRYYETSKKECHFINLLQNPGSGVLTVRISHSNSHELRIFIPLFIT